MEEAGRRRARRARRTGSEDQLPPGAQQTQRILNPISAVDFEGKPVPQSGTPTFGALHSTCTSPLSFTATAA